MKSIMGELSKHVDCFTRGQPFAVSQAIRQVMLGLHMATEPTLAAVGRVLDEETRDGGKRKLIHTVRRLSHHMRNARFNDTALEQNLLDWVTPMTTADEGRDLTVCVDRTDITHPKARPDRPRGLENACMCWDGSTKQKAMGYPMVQIESTDGEISIPIMYRLFSYAQEGYEKGDETRIFLEAIEAASAHVGNQATWVFDRGFDSVAYIEGLDRLGLRYVIRLKDRSRKLRDRRDNVLLVEDMADKVQTNLPLKMKRPDGVTETIWVGGRAVRLLKDRGTPEEEERSIVVVKLPSYDGERKLFLITDRVLSRSELVAAARHYLRRWDIEESTRWLKDRRGWGLRLEDVRLLTFRGVQRMIWLMQAMNLFTVRLRTKAQGLITKLRLLTRVQSFGPTPNDPRYRLMAGIRDALEDAPRWTLEEFLTPG